MINISARFTRSILAIAATQKKFFTSKPLPRWKTNPEPITEEKIQAAAKIWAEGIAQTEKKLNANRSLYVNDALTNSDPFMVEVENFYKNHPEPTAEHPKIKPKNTKT